MNLAADIAVAAAFVAGTLAPSLLRRLRPMRARCAWCNRIHVSATGQACAACLEAVARDGRAAPDGWPEA